MPGASSPAIRSRTSGRSADSHLILEDAIELPFREVNVFCQRGDGKVAREMVEQPREQLAHRLALSRLRAENRRILRLPPGTPEVDHEVTGDQSGRGLTVIVGDERQRHVDAGGHAGRRPKVAVVHIDGVGLDADFGIAPRQQLCLVPVGRGAAAVEESRRSTAFGRVLTRSLLDERSEGVFVGASTPPLVVGKICRRSTARPLRRFSRVRRQR